MKRFLKLIILIASLVMILPSCSKMNDLHDKYLREGETIYLSKMDSLALHTGCHRVKVEYWITDPKAKKCLVEWNLGEDSMVVDVERTGKDQSGSFYIEDLDETTVSFDFTLLTADMEYPSLKTSAAVTVYGERYVSTLMGPTIKTISKSGDTITLKLAGHYENVIGYIFNYPSATGEILTKRVDVTSLSIKLENAAPSGQIEYAGVYKPAEDSIDEYITTYNLIEY